MKRHAISHLQQHYDLLVCGGGIYGAWTAYDAALRGLKVIIVEQNDWGSGTSSASSKLIHGGLRYLQTGGFSLVKKSLTEKQHLVHTAPHRVWRLRFGTPVYHYFGLLRFKIGLLIYDFLAGTPYAQRTHRYFNQHTFSAQFPCLNNTQLKGGYTYLDAQTDDARLVLEIIDGAYTAGATCLNYCRLQKVIETNGVITAAILNDKINHHSVTIKITTLANTSGRWITDAAISKQWGVLSKGIHLVMPKILTHEALLLTAKSDGRVFFVIPWYGMTLLGTTDTHYAGNINHVVVEQAEIDYLLSEANFALNTQWSQHDIQGQFAGIRVLQQSPSPASRDWQLKSTSAGAFYAIAGKLTSSRADAAILVDAICRHLGKNIACKTDTTPMPWLPKQHFKIWQQQTHTKAQKLGIDDESILWLLRRHGKRVVDILFDIKQNPLLARRVTPDIPLIMADLLFCLKNENVIHLEDLLRRRLPLLILHRFTALELHHFATLCGKEFRWNQATIKQETQWCVDKWLWHTNT